MKSLILLTLASLSLINVDCLSSSYEAAIRSKVASSVAKGERRAAERSAATRELCSRCRRPPVQCVCATLPPNKIETTTQVLILQHPAEFRRKTFSTVPLVPLVLQNATVRVGHSFEPQQVDPIRQAIANEQRIFLLFPGPDALALDSPSPESGLNGLRQEQHTIDQSSGAAPTTDNKSSMLILVDGTWTQARRMIRDSPSLLQCCQQVQFSCESKSIYDAIRKEPQGHCLSTLEACARALELLEPDQTIAKVASRHLHEALQSLVDKHLWFSQSSYADPRFVRRGESALKKQKRRLEIEHEIFGTRHVGDVQNNTRQVINLDDRAILRPLTMSDAEYVNSRWPHRSEKSLNMILHQIEAGVGCFGIEINGELCASIMRYYVGSIGMLHVDEAYRRRGYGQALLTEAEQAEPRKERFAFIVDGNVASEQLFSKQGWTLENPSRKRGTGRRRAKRKWIKKS